MIIASDIPLLRVQDIQGVMALAESTSVVLATDRRQNGTNALLMRPPGLIQYCYGEGSFQKHIEQARLIGIEPRVFESPTLALDVDVPADLELYREMLIERDLDGFTWQESA
jgi:2-phospho-L-lactate guanylyltransferase (CobY/MobA/RfbA family)